MKEITRIHIAKVAYDIELDAKKDIQKYVSALERYAEDAETLDDIEIRITELFAERGVAAGGVIAKDDVAAVRAQLGEPSDFAPEDAGDIVVGSTVDGAARKLYRDRDSAILGGVLAGIARFFGIDPLWVRLIFIVLLIASFGAASIVYLILWLIVPAAKTAAEKLQMSGRAVTLEEIKALGDRESTDGNSSAAITRRVLRIVTGIIVLTGAIGILVATLFIGFGLTFGTTDNSPIAAWRPQEAWWLALGLGLFVLAGLLLATLGFLLANALLRRQWTKRVGTAVVVIIIAGLASFFSGVGTMWYGSWQESIHLYDSRKVSTVKMPELKEVTSLVIESNKWEGNELRVKYIVSDNPHYELETMTSVKPRIVRDGTTATVSLEPIDRAGTRQFMLHGAATILRVYGPSLEQIEAKQYTDVSYYSEKPQDKLTITLQRAGFELLGTYDEVTVVQKEESRATLERATVGNLTVQQQVGTVTAGVVRKLTVTQSDVCPADSEYGTIAVRVQAISGGKMTYNGAERSAATIKQACGMVFIGSADEYVDELLRMKDYRW